MNNDEIDYDDNPDIFKPVEKDNELKTWIVDYVGSQLKPKNDEVTIEMVIEVMAKEFPDFLLPIAEENFIRGYKQALTDVEVGEKLYKEKHQEEILD